MGVVVGVCEYSITGHEYVIISQPTLTLLPLLLIRHQQETMIATTRIYLKTNNLSGLKRVLFGSTTNIHELSAHTMNLIYVMFNVVNKV